MESEELVNLNDYAENLIQNIEYLQEQLKKRKKNGDKIKEIIDENMAYLNKINDFTKKLSELLEKLSKLDFDELNDKIVDFKDKSFNKIEKLDKELNKKVNNFKNENFDKINELNENLSKNINKTQEKIINDNGDKLEEYIKSNEDLKKYLESKITKNREILKENTKKLDEEINNIKSNFDKKSKINFYLNIGSIVIGIAIIIVLLI